MFEVWDFDYWCLKLIIKESDGLVNWFFYCKFNVRMLSIIGAFKELLLVCLLYSICSTFLAYFCYILFSKVFLIINNKNKYSILDKNFFCTNVLHKCTTGFKWRGILILIGCFRKHNKDDVLRFLNIHKTFETVCAVTYWT